MCSLTIECVLQNIRNTRRTPLCSCNSSHPPSQRQRGPQQPPGHVHVYQINKSNFPRPPRSAVRAAIRSLRTALARCTRVGLVVLAAVRGAVAQTALFTRANSHSAIVHMQRTHAPQSHRAPSAAADSRQRFATVLHGSTQDSAGGKGMGSTPRCTSGRGGSRGPDIPRAANARTHRRVRRAHARTRCTAQRSPQLRTPGPAVR